MTHVKEAVSAGKGFRNFAKLFHFPAVYVAVFCGFVVSAVVILIYPPAGEQATISGQLNGEPIWLPDILAGLFLGQFFYRRVPSRLAFLAWLPPAVFLLWSALAWQRSMAVYDSTWDTFFGKNCSGSECMYELLLTAPFYTAISYSAGALLGAVVKKK
jgi:hypothetical protein